MNGDDRLAPARTEAQTQAEGQARVRRGRWPGWIWAVPLAALLLVGWWALRTFAGGGETITIAFDDAHGLKPDNSTVVYRGTTVGKVKGVALAKDGKGVEVRVHMEDEADRFLRSGTRFWLRGATPSLSDPASLTALLSGPTIVMEPGQGEKTTRFGGLARRPVAPAADPRPQAYRVDLDGAVGGLKPGDPVTLRGFAVGEVRQVGFRFDAADGTVRTPVTVALYPALFHLGRAAAADPAAALRKAVDRLVANGLRARLDRDPPLVGAPRLTLATVPGASGPPPAPEDGMPRIPAASGGGIDDLVGRIGRLPLEQIGQNVLQATRRVDALVSSPALDDAVTELDAALKQVHDAAGQIDDTTRQIGPRVTRLVESLQRAARRIDQAAGAAKGAAEGAGQALGGVRSQHGLQDTLREIKEAARSVRELADYLTRHPEALVKGRSGG